MMPRAPLGSDWLGLATLTVLWGTAFLFNELALLAFGPETIVFLRIAIGATVIVAFATARGARFPRHVRGWVPMAVMALFGAVVPFTLTAWAQTHIDSATTAILMAIMPIMVLTLAHFFVPGAQLTRFRAAGFVVGFVGVACVIGPEALSGQPGSMAVAGAVAVLGAALSYASSSIYARRLGAVDTVSLSAGMLVVGALLTLPAAANDAAGISALTAPAVASVVILGLFSTGAATLIYFRIVQGPGPAFLSLVNYLVPGWAVLVGAVFLGEALAPSAWLGLALILSGVALSELGPRAVRWINACLARRTTAQRDASEGAIS